MSALQAFTLAVLASSPVGRSAIGSEVHPDDAAARAPGTGQVLCRVRLAGDAPALPRIAVNKSVEHCGPEIVDPVLLVEGGAIANAVAFLESADGRELSSSADGGAPPDVELRDEKCLMKARVLCARRGAHLVLRNDDKVTHNPHGWQPDGKTAFNLSLLPGQLTIRRKLKDVGVYRVDCDIHTWMRAYVHVFDHPWHGLSGADGLVRIGSVPPGRYRLVVWHEVLGTYEQELLVGPDETAQTEVVFDLVDRRPAKLLPAGMQPWIPSASGERAPSAAGSSLAGG